MTLRIRLDSKWMHCREKEEQTKMRTVIRLGRKADVLQDMQMTVAGVSECKSVSVSRIEKKDLVVYKVQDPLDGQVAFMQLYG